MNTKVFKTVKSDGTVIYRNSDGQYHCDHGPAVYMPEQKIEIWYNNGLMHREDGPAFIVDTETNLKFNNEYVENIKTKRRNWYQHGFKHRTDGPAEVTNFYIKWYHRGVLHNTDGPARIVFDFDEPVDINMLENYDKFAEKIHRTCYINDINWIIDGEICDEIDEWIVDKKFTYPLSDPELFELKLQFF